MENLKVIHLQFESVIVSQRTPTFFEGENFLSEPEIFDNFFRKSYVENQHFSFAIRNGKIFQFLTHSEILKLVLFRKSL